MDLELKRVRKNAKPFRIHTRKRLAQKVLCVRMWGYKTHWKSQTNQSDEFSFQAFTDMQVNKIETTKKLKMLEMQTEMLKTSKKKYDITDKEVSGLANDTR